MNPNGFPSEDELMVAAPAASPALEALFVVFTVLLAAGIVWNVYLAGRGLREPWARTRAWTMWTAAGLALWLLLTWTIAASGILARFSLRPPPMVFMFVVVLASAAVIAFGEYGRRFAQGLPFWILVAGQGFRLPLELLMHQAAHEGVMPIQMSYAGWNFDIVTGATAIPLAWLLARGTPYGRALTAAWNLMGLLLLANILTIAMVSTPIVAAFGPERLNTWVAYPPFVWLPTVMVVCALAGHLIIFRKLQATATPPPARRSNRHARP